MKLVICTKFQVNRINCVKSRKGDWLTLPPPLRLRVTIFPSRLLGLNRSIPEFPGIQSLINRKSRSPKYNHKRPPVSKHRRPKLNTVKNSFVKVSVLTVKYFLRYYRVIGCDRSFQSFIWLWIWVFWYDNRYDRPSTHQRPKLAIEYPSATPRFNFVLWGCSLYALANISLCPIKCLSKNLINQFFEQKSCARIGVIIPNVKSLGSRASHRGPMIRIAFS